MGNQEWLLQSLIEVYYDEALSATFALNGFRGFCLTVASSLALFIIYSMTLTLYRMLLIPLLSASLVNPSAWKRRFLSDRQAFSPSTRKIRV